MSFIGTAVIGSAVIGGISSAYSASKAADAQKAAAKTASDTAMGMYNTTRGDLQPYRDIGSEAGSKLMGRIDELTKPISVNPDDFQNSEQYKFQQQQGEKAAQNSAAARGLGTSGAAFKGALAFNNGLNSQQWQQNFNNQNTNQTNAYQRLKGLIDTGASAATGTATAGTAAANTSASASMAAGNAQAAADNKIGQSIANTANGIGGYAAYKGLYGGSSGGSSGVEATGWAGSRYEGPVAP